MALLLAALGAFVYVRLGSELDHAIDAGLRSRADDVAALVRRGEPGLGESGVDLSEADESFAQVLTPDGEIVDAALQVAGIPLLDADELARTAAGPLLLERDVSPVGDEPVRLLATSVDVGGARRVVVVAASTGDRQEALDGLRTQLLLGGPLALLLASLAGYGLAAAALAPVERMRRRAETISRAGPGERLPEPPTRDELGELARTLNAMLGRLDEAAARERRFVADASHELRRPLTLMQAQLEVTLRRPAEATELEAALRSTLDEVGGLTRLADDLLLITQADHGSLPIRAEPIELQPLLAGMARRFAARAADQGRTIELDVAAPTVRGDRLRLEQALGNLLDNALRHGAGTITLAAMAVREERVRLSVEDDGGGFPADFAPRAFERFSRADPARSTAGAGLGLAIVAAVAEAHGGVATIEEGPAGRTNVGLELPRR